MLLALKVIQQSKLTQLKPSSPKNRFIHRFAANMYNVDITGGSLFVGAFPGNIPVAASSYSSAIRHYKTALNGRQQSTGNRTVLESRYGFRIRIDASRSASSASIRLSLPSSANRESVARALSGRNGRVVRNRSGIVVRDPYGVTWTLS